MTAIRKTSLQVAYFQGFTNLTTDLCTSNDRFGIKEKLFTNCIVFREKLCNFVAEKIATQTRIA